MCECTQIHIYYFSYVPNVVKANTYEKDKPLFSDEILCSAYKFSDP